MGDELLDVVDENNVIIRQEKRSIVHRDQLRHRAVHIFVVNSKNELLIQKRCIIKDEFPGYWDSSSAGHVDAGESYESTAARELKEELDIPAIGLTYLADLPADASCGWEFTRFYWLRSDHPITFQTTEIEAVEFLPLDAIKRELSEGTRLYTPKFKEFFDIFCERVDLARQD